MASVLMSSVCSISVVARVAVDHQFGMASSVSSRLQERDRNSQSTLPIFGQEHATCRPRPPPLHQTFANTKICLFLKML